MDRRLEYEENHTYYFQIFLACLAVNCTTSELYFSSMDVQTNIKTRQILNLRVNDFLTKEETVYGEKLMKSGFLDTTKEKLGYYNGLVR
jgi:hypothetical protein